MRTVLLVGRVVAGDPSTLPCPAALRNRGLGRLMARGRIVAVDRRHVRFALPLDKRLDDRNDVISKASSWERVSCILFSDLQSSLLRFRERIRGGDTLNLTQRPHTSAETHCMISRSWDWPR